MEWLTPALLGIVCALVGVVYASLLRRIDDVKKEIGDRKSGLRGASHEHANRLKVLAACLVVIASHIGGETKATVLRWLKLWRE